MSKHTKNQKRHNYKQVNSLYIYGRNPVFEMVQNKPSEIIEIILIESAKDNLHSYKNKKDFAQIIQKAKHAKIPVKYITKKEAIAIIGDVRTQRILAQVKPFKYTSLKEWVVKHKNNKEKKDCELVIVLDKVEDPQNFGAIIRSAGAVGVSAVFVANANQAPVNATVFKASAGVITKVPIVQVANIGDTLNKLRDLGFWTYGVSMEQDDNMNVKNNEYTQESKNKSNTFYKLRSRKSGTSIWDQTFDKNTVLVLGSEGSGLSKIAKEHCDFLVHIPMQNGVESLNVSISAALAMYEWRRKWN